MPIFMLQISRHIVTVIDPEKGINLESFNENFKSTSAELKEQVWAVHASRILPSDTLIPFITNEDSRPGLSWEDHGFAV